MLGMKIVTELDLSFVDFVDKEVNELKYYGMSLVHLNPFKIVVKELESHTTTARADLVTDTSLVGQHADALSSTSASWKIWKSHKVSLATSITVDLG